MGKSKFFSSGQSDLIIDPLEGNKVAVDFETLSIPEGPISISPVKGNNILEASTKIQSDYLVGEKRLAGSRIEELIDLGKNQNEMIEVLSIGNEAATKRPRLV